MTMRAAIACALAGAVAALGVAGCGEKRIGTGTGPTTAPTAPPR